MTTLSVDVHAHQLVAKVEELARGHDGWRREVERLAALSSAQSEQRNRELMETVYRPKFGIEARIAAMDAMAIDVQAVSIVPSQYHYWAERALAQRIVSAANEGIAELCRSRPQRLVGLATVALQHPDLAVAQLEHAMGELGLKGAILSTTVNGVEIADLRFEPFWSKAAELGALVFIHPMGCSLGTRLAPYYLSNVIGNPTETTIALAHLVFGGVLDRHPRVKICAAHGGGYFPFYCGRFDHGWRVRPEARTCRQPPSDYLQRIWFDSLVYRPDSLEYLVRRAGASQVVVGTDFPFDMGVEDPLGRLEAVAGLSQSERRAVRGANAARLLGLEADR